MSISRPAGIPSMIVTRVWPCDSPAVRNLSILVQFYTRKLRTFAGPIAIASAESLGPEVAWLECMTRLLHDRYFAYAAEHAWDLATGESVLITDLATGSSKQFAPVAESLIEVLDQGRV